MLIQNRKYREIKNSITKTLFYVIDLYSKIDNHLYINSERINLNKEKVKRISLINDVDFYFAFFNAVSKYRENLKQLTAEYPVNNSFLVESRVKNINSISSKIYQYINYKSEKGEVAINKCLNDLYGVRLILKRISFKNEMKLIKEIIEENRLECKVINASKQKYKAIHLYLKGDSSSLRWEIQFWLASDDKTNRQSHAIYKQAYTKWEDKYKKKDLYKEISQ